MSPNTFAFLILLYTYSCGCVVQAHMAYELRFITLDTARVKMISI